MPPPEGVSARESVRSRRREREATTRAAGAPRTRRDTSWASSQATVNDAEQVVLYEEGPPAWRRGPLIGGGLGGKDFYAGVTAHAGRLQDSLSYIIGETKKKRLVVFSSSRIRVDQTAHDDTVA